MKKVFFCDLWKSENSHLVKLLVQLMRPSRLHDMSCLFSPKSLNKHKTSKDVSLKYCLTKKTNNVFHFAE